MVSIFSRLQQPVESTCYTCLISIIYDTPMEKNADQYIVIHVSESKPQNREREFVLPYR